MYFPKSTDYDTATTATTIASTTNTTITISTIQFQQGIITTHKRPQSFYTFFKIGQVTLEEYLKTTVPLPNYPANLPGQNVSGSGFLISSIVLHWEDFAQNVARFVSELVSTRNEMHHRHLPKHKNIE